VAITLIYGIFFLAYFGGSLTGYNIIPSEFTVLTEIFIYVLFLYSIIYKKSTSYHFHLLYLFLFFVFIALCSAIVNHCLSVRIIYSLRLLIRFYIFYLALINLELSAKQLVNINRLLFLFFLIQLPVSAIKFCYYGVSELTMGTYTVRGGGPTTLIPIIALGFLTGFYAFHKPRKIYFLLGIGFILYGILGAKKALFFLFPITFLGLYFLVYIKGKGVRIVRDVAIVVIIAMLSVTVLVAMMKYMPQLNTERKVGGSIDLSYTLDYLKKYTESKNRNSPNIAMGRTATTLLVIEELNKVGLAQWSFGFGPGVLTGSMFDNKPYVNRLVSRIDKSYGITGMTYILTEYGVFGLLCIGLMFLIFVYRSWQWYKCETNPYWRAFSSGALVFAVLDMFIFFFYSVLVVMDDTITPTFFYVMAVMYIRHRQIDQKNKALFNINQ